MGLYGMGLRRSRGDRGGSRAGVCVRRCVSAPGGVRPEVCKCSQLVTIRTVPRS